MVAVCSLVVSLVLLSMKTPKYLRFKVLDKNTATFEALIEYSCWNGTAGIGTLLRFVVNLTCAIAKIFGVRIEVRTCTMEWNSAYCNCISSVLCEVD